MFTDAQLQGAVRFFLIRLQIVGLWVALYECLAREKYHKGTVLSSGPWTTLSLPSVMYLQLCICIIHLLAACFPHVSILFLSPTGSGNHQGYLTFPKQLSKSRKYSSFTWIIVKHTVPYVGWAESVRVRVPLGRQCRINGEIHTCPAPTLLVRPSVPSVCFFPLENIRPMAPSHPHVYILAISFEDISHHKSGVKGRNLQLAWKAAFW